MATFLARAEGLTATPPPERCSILPADNIWNRRVDGLPEHSLSDDYIAAIGAGSTLHADFEVTARTPEGVVMAIRHAARPLYGVQFHPESIMTVHGKELLANFLAG